MFVLILIACLCEISPLWFPGSSGNILFVVGFVIVVLFALLVVPFSSCYIIRHRAVDNHQLATTKAWHLIVAGLVLVAPFVIVSAEHWVGHDILLLLLEVQFFCGVGLAFVFVLVLLYLWLQEEERNEGDGDGHDPLLPQPQQQAAHTVINAQQVLLNVAGGAVINIGGQGEMRAPGLNDLEQGAAAREQVQEATGEQQPNPAFEELSQQEGEHGAEEEEEEEAEDDHAAASTQLEHPSSPSAAHVAEKIEP